MKKFHLALGVKDIRRSVKDYSKRLGCSPEVVIPGVYALWRTQKLNFSIRKVSGSEGVLRHLGWEEPSVKKFTKKMDVNGIIWESFSSVLQRQEIHEIWGKRVK